MNKYLVIFTLILFLTSCGPTPTVVPSAPTKNLNSLETNPTTYAPQEPVSTTDVQPSFTVTSAPESATTLSLQIISPQDETVVNTSQVDVIGSGPAGTVVSVNDEILLVGADGQFKTTITLDEGPNLIEIIASDESGNEIPLLLTITYEP